MVSGGRDLIAGQGDDEGFLSVEIEGSDVARDSMEMEERNKEEGSERLDRWRERGNGGMNEDGL